MEGEPGRRPEGDRVDDARRTVTYLTVPESDEYIAIMSVLEAAPTDLTCSEIIGLLRERGTTLTVPVAEARLSRLREWAAVSARSDQTHVRRAQDLLLRNFRYAATRQGRQVQRFYESVLAGAAVMREIPLQSLNTVVVALETLAAADRAWPDSDWVRARVNEAFTAHDDLDGSLVGAEDTLMGLAARFDLDDERTDELKTLLVGYATRIAVELERGSDRAAIALSALRPEFERLAGITVTGSEASGLIGRNLLAASRGGALDDWRGLVEWFDRGHGRSARFQTRMVAAIPTFHANLRRLHTAGESGTSRSRALALARACLHPELGPQIYLAALGDHSWRKLHGEADDPGAGATPRWRDGPQVAVPDGLRTHGRSGVRGPAPAPIDDTAARAAVSLARAARLEQHQASLREVLAADAGATLSHGAARLALTALMAAVRRRPRGNRRSVTYDGLGCTVFWTGSGAGRIVAPSWSVLLPGRMIVFHRPGVRPAMPGTASDPGGHVTIESTGAVA